MAMKRFIYYIAVLVAVFVGVVQIMPWKTYKKIVPEMMM